MYYLQSRYYNPEWGRFINVDGIVGQTGELLSHNMFAYCKNNPVMFHDPNGYVPLVAPVAEGIGEALLNAIVAVAGAIAAYVGTKEVADELSKTKEEDAQKKKRKFNGGPVIFRNPPNATQEQKRQVKEYVFLCNLSLATGFISPVGKVSTKGTLRTAASIAAVNEYYRAEAAGTPYKGVVGHVPDTTWTASPIPFIWMDMDATVNSSLGGQCNRYPEGYHPTIFIYDPF